jgi:hypothetical protein
MALIPNENNYILFNILTILKFNFNIGFRPMRKQVSISIVSIPPETSLTLVFAHCKSNPNPTISAFPETKSNISFHSLRKNSNPMVYAFPETSLTLAYIHCESNPNWIPLKSYYIHISFIAFWIFKNFQEFKVSKFNLVHLRQDFTYRLLRSCELLR